MKILLISGSIAKKSHTRTFLQYIEQLLKKEGVDTMLWDLAIRPLSIAIPEFHKDPSKNPDKNVQQFVQEVIESDGFVLGSPLYQGSFSGVLKNALDQLHYNAFLNKPVALVSNSSSVRNAAHPCEHLRLVVRALYGYVLQSQIGTADTDFTETVDGYVLASENIKERAVRLVNELVKFTIVLKSNAINQED